MKRINRQSITNPLSYLEMKLATGGGGGGYENDSFYDGDSFYWHCCTSSHNCCFDAKCSSDSQCVTVYGEGAYCQK